MSFALTEAFLESAKPVAQELVNFLKKSPTPFHAVKSVSETLMEKGFEEIDEKNSWETLQQNKSYFFQRQGTSLIAFQIGGKFEPGKNGFKIYAAHTDSPDLRLKPVFNDESNGFNKIGAQLYGGGLWHTWFDRDLTAAGRVIVNSGAGGLTSHLIDFGGEPICFIPSLAIHLDRSVNEKFTFNEESNFVPILNSAIENHPNLLQAIADKLKVPISSIYDFQISLFDANAPTLTGLNKEFIASARIDNLASCFMGMKGMLEEMKSLEVEEDIRVLVMFDHEEVGSVSSNGAGSNLLNSTLKRIITCLAAKKSIQKPDLFEMTIPRSICLSMDNAHAIHPNYSEKHEKNHKIKIHCGPVIKINCKQRYATSDLSSSTLLKIANESSIPMQKFVVRNDSLCGSTIGPTNSANTGILTVDCGIPQWAMHSIREYCGIGDIKHGVELAGCFYRMK